MIKNYLKIAIRNMLKYKIYSIVNIIGLSVGIACTIVLTLYVQNELSYDDYNENSDYIYRVAASYRLAGQDYELATTPAPLAKTLLEEFPEVEKVVRFREKDEKIVKYNNVVFKEQGMIHAGNSFFEIFTIPLIYGNKNDVLTRPNTIALSEKAAHKYFGKEDAIGKIVRVGDKHDYEVTGIYDNIPTNSHFHFDFIMSLETLQESKEGSWLSNNFNTYLELNKNSSAKKLEAKFPALIEKHLSNEIYNEMGMSLDDLKKKGGKVEFYLQPVTDIHLYSNLISELGENSDIKYVYIFSIMAFFILIIASINYMNISTALSATRAKEVGIRKVLGSERNDLMRQFIAESFLTTLISLLVSIGIVELVLPFFNEVSSQALAIRYFNNIELVIILVGILIFIGLLAGSYPAHILSSYNPYKVLSGKIKNNLKTGIFRSGLVIFQFVASIVLIIATMVVNKQLNFIQNKNLGYDKEHVIILTDAYLLGNQIESFKNEILNNKDVINASISGFLPVPSDQNKSAAFPEGKVEELATINQWSIDYDYLKTMRIDLAEGRDFNKKFGNDENSIIVNQAVADIFGFKNPIGKRLSSYINNKGDRKTYTIIGVIKDFHFESLRNSIEPLALYLGANTNSISFRITGAKVPELINELKTKWKKFVPNQPFNYAFLDEKFNEMYAAENKVSSIFAVFAGIAIFIGCLGLFSLSAFAAHQKTKEIGIRKVLGSSLFNIIYLLSNEFIKLILVAFIIATPIAYFFMSEWIADFAYRTNIGLEPFIYAGVIALLIAILTVSYQGIKAASLNPVDSLRNE